MTEETITELNTRLRDWSIRWGNSLEQQEKKYNAAASRANNNQNNFIMQSNKNTTTNFAKTKNFTPSAVAANASLSSKAHKTTSIKSSSSSGSMSLIDIQSGLSKWSNKWETTLTKFKSLHNQLPIAKQQTSNSTLVSLTSIGAPASSPMMPLHLPVPLQVTSAGELEDRQHTTKSRDIYPVPSNAMKGGMLRDIVNTGKVAEIQLEHKKIIKELEHEHQNHIADLETARDVAEQSVTLYKDEGTKHRKQLKELHDQLTRQMIDLTSEFQLLMLIHTDLGLILSLYLGSEFFTFFA